MNSAISVRTCNPKHFSDHPSLSGVGLSTKLIHKSVDYVHELLDGIDLKLAEAGSERLSQLVELANLSAIIGNLFRGGVVRFSNGGFSANTPHTYPDLIGKGKNCKDIEIKVALENNKPKGHLVKPGPHIIVRYVLADSAGKYTRGKEFRGVVPWIWEVRFGSLKKKHFNVSNTAGDSGKTAVVNADGMNSLQVMYCDLERCPLSPSGKAFKTMQSLFG